ncbi:13573_t:CDS:10 [Rhizophagus irregularis]|nr:13573_t:CDS:10 [Rhizophagus irregularis]
MPIGRQFKPKEPYTHRLRKILDEYPDGSQILREILQNSDDAQSTEQIFILDHNTYPSQSLFEPDYVDNYQRTNLKLDRFQGPALLSRNTTTFEEKDFQSLLKLADSEKRDQFDKIGVMGVGFNSIYHITDSPSFITGDKYIILDPHEWYFNGGIQFDFVKEQLSKDYPDQFAPFKISCDKPFNGTIFRYPLRTNQDSVDSKISNKVYKPEAILDMFHKFYEKESINCLLFLKYIERIHFYELKEGATEPELLYTIQLENVDDHVREQRRSIVEKIIPMMNSLKSKDLDNHNQLETSYVASFSRQRKGYPKEISSWLILNYLDDLLKAEAYFHENFGKYIGDYKFIPNVGLAVPLNNLNATGKLFCFLPLPIDMPFLVSVHGYFAVSTNRRSLWSAADNEDLAVDALARLKVEWNRYLFEKVLPKAWVKFLRELRSNIQSDNIYEFWPIVKEVTSGSLSSFCKDLLQNVIESLSIDDCVFKGPFSSNVIGTVAEVSTYSYNMPSFREPKFHWLSLSNGYFEDEKLFNFDLSKIIGNIGFPVISTLYPIIRVLKSSGHQDSLKFFSPTIIRTYLSNNRDRWDNVLSRKEVLLLFEYILNELNDQNFDELEGFKIIPLADGVNLGTLTQFGNSYVYIGPDDDIKSHENDERNIFTNQLDKFIDKSISFRLYKLLYDNANTGWDLNIKILDEFAVVDMIKFSLNFAENANFEVIQMPNHCGWIYQLWDNLRYRNWDLTKFEDIHLIPTNRSSLRKLRTPNKIFLNQTSEDLTAIFEIFGAAFADNQFKEISEWDKVSPYIIKLNDIISVLASFRADASYPENLNKNLQIHEASALIDHLSNYLRLVNKDHLTQELIEVIKHLPIFTEIDHTLPISLLPGNSNWYILPREEENSYGKIIYPSNMGGFLSTNSQNICYILEDIIKVPRLNVIDYWQNYVIPFIDSQSPEDIDIVIDRLFDRLQSLLDYDANLKDILGRKSFVAAGTFEMSRHQKISFGVKLIKSPTDLFDPEEKTLVDLFFEDEKVFPAGKYGISQSSSNRFLSNLKLLGIKSILSPNDIIIRIDTIISRRQFSNICDNLIHSKALKLLKYVDEKWNQLTNNNNNHATLEAILEKEWIPTVDEYGKKVFSKPVDCYYKKYKNLVCFVAPVLDYNPKNHHFLEYLNWHTYPDVKTVLRQLELCRHKNKSPVELKSICDVIYEYMNEAFHDDKTSFDYMREYLKNESWILCGDTFYSSDKVVFDLPNKFQYKDSLIVKLPIEYSIKFEKLYKAMGVRDKIGVKELIFTVKNEYKDLSTEEIIQILKQIIEIRKDNRRDGNQLEELDGLLIPSNNNALVELNEIQFDDMADKLEEEERSRHKIAHHLDCSTNSIFKEFLRNADDTGAKHFSVIIDERQHDFSPPKKIFLSEEIEDWQGPAIWIYNDEEFTNDSFQSLLNLDIGNLNYAFHVTDLLSIVSGRYIAFLDPHAKFLPPSGFPLKRPRGIQIDFIEKKFKKSFPEQCDSYEEILHFIEKCFPDKYATGDCDMSKEFRGTLFRIPLRTFELAKVSDISNKVINTNKILELFNNIQDNNEMLFLRNIESCSLYHMKDKDSQLIWQSKISSSDSCRNARRKMVDSIDNAQVYQLDIERINDMGNKVSEIWAICVGGHDRIKPEFKEFSEKKQVKPRGGVASLLAQSYIKSLDELRAESFPDPPEITGDIYSHLSLSISSNLGVHLNGNFSLPSKGHFLQANCDDAKWNRYILYDVLPDLHIKLLEHIVVLEETRYKKEGTDFVPHTADKIWPIPVKLSPFMDLYRKYGLDVIRKLGLNNQKFFWTEVNGGQFVSLREARIFEKEKAIIADLLVNSGISAVKLGKDKIRQLSQIVESGDPPNFPYEPVTGESVCEKLHEIPDIHDKLDNKHDSLFELLNFILQDKNSYEILTGLSLVPLSNESVGKFGEVYYIGKKEHLDLFPNTGPSKFVSIDLPEYLFKIFNDVNFPAFTNIKKFDASAVLDLLTFELPPLKERSWDPNGESIPNDDWLKKIWSILNKVKEEREFTRLTKYPLLPMIQPSKLVRLDTKNPLLYIPENGHILYPILVKLQVRFTNMKFPEDAHENLKKCIVSCTPTNIINSLEWTCSLLHKPMEQLFKTSDLSLSDYEKLRKFIKEELNVLLQFGKKQELIKILRSLPIWPIHSGEEKFIDATAGKLLTYKLPFFSFDNNTDFYKYDRESDFKLLSRLGTTLIKGLEYFESYIIPHIAEKSLIPSQEYIIFLKNFLNSSGYHEIKCLEQYQMIPNKSLTAFVKADTLYDMEVILFLNIFDTDKFLPPELQNDPVCLRALGNIGLNRQVNCDTFIKCAREIESQFQQPDKFPTNIVKNRAKYLIDYLYTNIIIFSTDQWNQIMHIKFIPSEKYLQSPFQEEAKETLGYESFAVLCFQRYKEVCWTERPLFERNVEPDNSFCERYSNIGKPALEEIVKHWFFFVEEIKSKIIWKSSDIKSVMEEIYKIMNEFSHDDIMKGLIKLKINDSNKKLFLNGDDPLDGKSWVAGRELIFGIQEDIKEGMYKVKTCLMPYKDLLLLAGAYEINTEELEELEKLEKLKKSEKNAKIDQKEILVNDLLDKLIAQSNNEYHDVFFTFDEEEGRIGACRYVLSAASSYFKRMFYSGLIESSRDVIEILIKGIHPDTFWILLRWLYGQSFEDAVKSVLRKPDDFNTDQYLSFLVDLLQVTDIYDVESLKDKVEDTIIKGRYIGVRNLCKILISSEECNAQQLKNYYKKHITSNRNLIKEQLLKLHTNAANDVDRSDISQMSQLLEPFLSDDE